MVLLVSYDLIGKERPASYEAVKATIEAMGPCIKPLYSQWFLHTNLSPQTVCDALTNAGVIDKGDRLLVLQIQWPYQGWLDPTHWEWLQARV